ncbi:TetR/AcrR family transcriptional regulator [Novosphingobium malaysiense]|uniref:HTH tetR-type domain-containing protein n=1 Tax=Novosphingobium malaysiense TaxID=1348853 RepID=A0A0B1ZDE3_9SPHN|nr:TetR/AcrR family transcriptional regulator [Novosphingobium malaysiense]KHK89054.1 hypothetical protein LK12_22115 [Novosphingobium malaysiense]
MTRYRSYNALPDQPEGTSEIRDRIIAAATQLFEEHGFRKTSIDAITRDARTSKRTVYEYFPDKHAILSVVLAQFIRQRFTELERMKAQDSGLPPRDVLRHLAQGLSDVARDGESKAMYRLLLAEADHVPDIARASHDIGLQQVVELVHKPLSALGIGDAEMAAQIFYDVFVMAPLNRALVGVEPMPINVDVALDALLDGFSRT